MLGAAAMSREVNRAEGLLDPRALRLVFQDLLGRPPLSGERRAWRGQPLRKLVEELLASEELWKNWLEEQLYYFLLVDNFRPAGDSLQKLPRQLARGDAGIREALLRICLSSSFDRRNPGPDTFVSVVMEQVLGVTVQNSTRDLEIGKRAYDGGRGSFLGKPASCQADIVNISMADQRALSHFLQRESQRLVRRMLPLAEARTMAGRLEEAADSYRDILFEWLTSDAYRQRLVSSSPQPNRLFVRSLLVDLFDRVPDEVEAQRLCTALDGLADSTPLRSLLARLILDSGKAPVPDRESIGDPAAWITEQFERLLGRSPTGTELKAFSDAFSEPSCRPTTILYAIVSHPEYQRW